MIDAYYADLATNALNDAIKRINEARQYLKDANCPIWIDSNLKKTRNGLTNRIDNIILLRKGKNQ